MASSRSLALIGGDGLMISFVSEMFSVVGILAISEASLAAAISRSLLFYSATAIDAFGYFPSIRAFSAFGSGKPSRFHLP